MSDDIMDEYARQLMGEEAFIELKRKRAEALDKAQGTAVDYWWQFLPSRFDDEESD
jgi:hypothetical protein